MIFKTLDLFLPSMTSILVVIWMFIFSYNCFMIPFKMHHTLNHSLTSFNNINQNGQINKPIKEQEHYFTNVDVNGFFRMLVVRPSDAKPPPPYVILACLQNLRALNRLLRDLAQLKRQYKRTEPHCTATNSHAPLSGKSDIQTERVQWFS